MMMQPGYFVEGGAMMVYPVSPDYFVGGSVLKPGRSGSIVEIGRFQVFGGYGEAYNLALVTAENPMFASCSWNQTKMDPEEIRKDVETLRSLNR